MAEGGTVKVGQVLFHSFCSIMIEGLGLFQGLTSLLSDLDPGFRIWI